jgi:hypothetical protein
MAARPTTPSDDSFNSWFGKYGDDIESGADDGRSAEQSVSLLLQFNSIQDSVTGQFLEFSGSIADGPLGASFRTRILHSIYLLIAAVAMATLAVLVGLPTIVLHPSKFVVLITLSTIFAASSVIVMQTPAVFLTNFLIAGVEKKLSVVSLCVSLLFTLYAAIIVHTYACVVLAGALQMLSMLYYLSSFIPGGTKGLSVLLKTGFMLVKTAMSPCIYMTKKTLKAFFKQVFK